MSKPSLVLFAALLLASAEEIGQHGSYDIGLNFRNVYDDSERVRLVVQVGTASPTTEGPFQVATLTHRTHEAQGAEPFPALEIRRTYTAEQMAAGIKAKLVTEEGREGSAIGLVIYRFPPQ